MHTRHAEPEPPMKRRTTHTIARMLTSTLLVVAIMLVSLAACSPGELINRPKGADTIATRTAKALLAAGQPAPSPVPTWTPTPQNTVTPTDTPVPVYTPVADVSLAALNPITFTLATPTAIPPLSEQTITSNTINLLVPRRELGYGQAVQAAIAPDNKLIAIATSAGVAWLDTTTQQFLRFDPVDGGATSITFSASGQLVAVGQNQSYGLPVTLILHSVDGTLVAALQGAEPVFSPNGQFVATTQQGSDTDEATTWLWRSTDGVKLATLTGHAPRFSPGGQFVVTQQDVAGRQSAVLLWQTSDGTLLRDLIGSSPTFSPDRQWLAGITLNGVTLWNLAESGKDRTQAIQAAGTGDEQLLAFNADGKELRVRVPDGVIAWNLADDTLAHRSGLNGVFDRSDDVLVDIGSGGEGLRTGIRLTHASDGAILYEDATLLFSDNPGYGVSRVVAFNRDSTTAVLVAINGLVRVVKLSDGTLTDVSLPAFQAIAFAPDGATLLTARAGPVVDVWQVNELLSVQQLRTVAENALSSEVTRIRTEPDATKVTVEVVTHDYGNVGNVSAIQWDRQAGSAGAEIWSQAPLQGGSYTLRDWTYHPATNAVAWINENNQVVLSRSRFITEPLSTGASTLILTDPGPFTALAFHPDGSLLAIGDENGTVQLVKTTGGYLYDTLQPHGGVERLTFNKDGSLLGIQRTDGTLLVWPVGKPQPSAYLTIGAGSRFLFTPDNHIGIATGLDGVTFYSLSNGMPLRTLDVDASDIAIDPTQRFLALLQRGRVIVWGL